VAERTGLSRESLYPGAQRRWQIQAFATVLKGDQGPLGCGPSCPCPLPCGVDPDPCPSTPPASKPSLRRCGRQLIEAVGRKLDRLLHQHQPARQRSPPTPRKLLSCGSRSRSPGKELLSGWPTAGSTAWRRCVNLIARAGIRSGAKVLMPAHGCRHPAGAAETLMRTAPAARGAAAPAGSTGLNQLLDARSPRPPPAADPQGKVTGAGAGGCAASITSLLPNLSRGCDDAHERCLLPG